MIVSQIPGTAGRSSATYFDRKHRKRENVALLAVCSSIVLHSGCLALPIAQWDRDPLVVLSRIHFLDNGSAAKAHDEGVTSLIYEDIPLANHRYGNGVGLETSPHLNLSVDHTTRVKITDALGDFG